MDQNMLKMVAIVKYKMATKKKATTSYFSDSLQSWTL